MNSDVTTVLSAGALTTFTVEFIKWLVRKFIVKSEEFDFHPTFYKVALPLVTAAWGLALYYVGIGQGQFIEWKSLLEWFLSVVISLATYTLVNKPFKQYTQRFTNKG